MHISTEQITALALGAFMLTILPGCGTTQTTNHPSASNNQDSVSGSIKDLLGMDKSQKCIWTGVDGEVSTIYTDGEKSRVEVTGYMGDSDQKMISMTDGEWTYVWVEGSDAAGTKMKVTDLEDIEDEYNDWDESDDSFEDEDFDDEMNGEYSCENWHPKSSMFKAPSDVEFTDMAEQFGELNNYMDSMKDFDYEGLCDMVPPSEKENCLADIKQ